MPSLELMMVHEAQLRKVAAQINQANAIIEATKKGCQAAAEVLAQNWSGAARDAFVAEQIKANSWLEKMIQIIAELSATINKVSQTYNSAEQTVSKMIKGK
jgi:WXG100 family type VII secretion target